jgi:hypothetical protein
MWTPPINEIAELTQGALLLIHNSEDVMTWCCVGSSSPGSLDSAKENCPTVARPKRNTLPPRFNQKGQSWHPFFLLPYLLAVLWIREILVRIRIRVTVPWLTDLDPDQDPAIFVRGWEDVNKFFFKVFFAHYVLVFEGTVLLHKFS